METPADAIVLFAHGSRDPAWHAPIQAVARRIGEAAPGLPVRCAYLELTEPDLPRAVAGLVGAGARHIRIVPMFLGVGRHAREDLPRLLAQAQVAWPTVQFELRPAVGEEPALIELLARLSLDP